MATDRTVISCPTAPPAIGPYSHAIKANGVLYCSGSVGINPTTKTLVEGGVAAQARQVLDNLKNVIEYSGASMTNVVKCTVLLTDMANFAEFNAVYAEYFPADPPARMTYAVVGLPAGALVEIDAIAVMPN